MQQNEHFFSCPYCGSRISILVDNSVAHQEFVEDCEVCCRPLNIQYEIADEEIISFDVVRVQ